MGHGRFLVVEGSCRRWRRVFVAVVVVGLGCGFLVVVVGVVVV